MDKIVNVCSGSCASCSKNSLLREELCRECYSKYKNWGPGGWKPAYAEILRKCKADKKFAYMLYSRLTSELAKAEFESSFGPFLIHQV